MVWEEFPPFRPSWFTSKVVRRFRPGKFVLTHDRQVGRWAAGRLAALQPGRVYAFTQVGLESLEWARANGVPTILDNPNGHIRGFAEVYQAEWARWVGGRFRGHPTDEMIARVEQEYELADRIRVSSEWAKPPLLLGEFLEIRWLSAPYPSTGGGSVPGVPPTRHLDHSGFCYVGTLDVRKGFVYLLRAIRRVGPDRVRLEIIGGTGNRGSRWLFARERAGLDVVLAAGDPVPAYHRAELFVLPSLEDGFGFVAAEAMACGIPVVVTDQCGAAEWVTDGETGWVIPAGMWTPWLTSYRLLSSDAPTCRRLGARPAGDRRPGHAVCSSHTIRARPQLRTLEKISWRSPGGARVRTLEPTSGSSRPRGESVDSGPIRSIRVLVRHLSGAKVVHCHQRAVVASSFSAASCRGYRPEGVCQRPRRRRMGHLQSAFILGSPSLSRKLSPDETGPVLLSECRWTPDSGWASTGWNWPTRFAGWGGRPMPSGRTRSPEDRHSRDPRPSRPRSATSSGALPRITTWLNTTMPTCRTRGPISLPGRSLLPGACCCTTTS